MTLKELLPAVRELPVGDKIRLIRILAEELESVEDISPLEPHKIYYLPTPYNIYGAGKVLMEPMNPLENED